MVRKKTLKEKQLTMFTARGAGGILPSPSHPAPSSSSFCL